MSYSQETFDALKTKIIEAFEYVEYPKGLITEHECEECFGVRKIFLNKDWKQITPKILQENYDKLPLFSPEAFHCFYPAYLIYSLEHFTEDEVSDFVVYNLMVRSKVTVKDTDYWKRKFQYFTKTQINLILEFVDLVIQSGEYESNVLEINNGKQILLNIAELR